MTNQVQSRRALPRLRQSESLAAIISQSGPLPEEQVWSIIDKVLERLEILHAQGSCHRALSLSTIGIDASGELELAATIAPVSISDLVRLHVPLPSCMRHEFDLVIPCEQRQASSVLSDAGFAGSGVALDLFQIAVLTIRLIFDVDGEKFLASSCLHETLSPDLARVLRGLLTADNQDLWNSRILRAYLPGALVEAPVQTLEACSAQAISSAPTLDSAEADTTKISPCLCSCQSGHSFEMDSPELINTHEPAPPIASAEAPLHSPATPKPIQPEVIQPPLATVPNRYWVIGVAVFVMLALCALAIVLMLSGRT